MMNKYTKKYSSLVLLICGGATFQVNAADSTSVRFHMSVPNPTCNVSVSGGNTVLLGELKTDNGQEQTHSNKKFTITADCNGVGSAGRNALTAGIVNNLEGVVQGDKVRVAVKMGSNAVDNTNGPFLKLKNGNTDVKLDNTTMFCATSDKMLRCELTPVTSVFKGAPTGDGSVAIRFNVSYPI